jgi:hypothetical protein
VYGFPSILGKKLRPTRHQNPFAIHKLVRYFTKYNFVRYFYITEKLVRYFVTGKLVRDFLTEKRLRNYNLQVSKRFVEPVPASTSTPSSSL